MTPLAFYAPMKPPGHSIPSGDRTMARALIAALDAGGYRAEVASAFSSRDKTGDAALQSTLVQAAGAEAERLIGVARDKGWRAWITYHNYYKTPDLIGPAVSNALGLPYVLIESTRARKRLTGPWAEFAAKAEAASDAARAILYLTRHDEEALRAYGHAGQKLVHLPPFLQQNDLPDETTRSAGILSVGMFRPGDKIDSYRLIADTLAQLESTDWTLRIAGDGPARAQVETMMRRFGERVHFLGAQDAEGMRALYATSSILFWPGVNEAFGMTYLEAQAAGLAVLAQDRPGVRDVLAPGAAYPAPEAGAPALAARLGMLLRTPKLALYIGQSARQYVKARHLMPAAVTRLKETLEDLLT